MDRLGLRRARWHVEWTFALVINKTASKID